MFQVAGHIYPVGEIDMPRTERPLMVTACGHIVVANQGIISTARPEGRRDYQLLYVHSGLAYYMLHGKEQKLSAGQMIFYHPNEPQFYHYDSADTPDAYWIHFIGNDVPRELENLNLFSKRIYYPKSRDIFPQIFNTIIQELQQKKQYYYSIADSRFKELLCLMSREIAVHDEMGAPHTREIEQAVRLFHTHFDHPGSLAEYAASCNMSVCWFTQLFKRQLGVSPQQYLMNIRISRACELLASGSGVAEASEAIGYVDALYFSRIFKKHTGQTPSQYRKAALSRIPELPDF